MRYGKDHKAETRKRILRTASQRFRQEGIEAVGVASLMADAGLTHGGFYAHFPSKEDLVAEAAADALAQTVAYLREAADQAKDGERVKAIARRYLSPQHRDNPGQGCAAAALAAEIGRHPDKSRKTFTPGVQALIDLIADHLRADGDDPRQAMSIVAAMVGSLVLARAVDAPELSAAILRRGKDAVDALARGPRAKGRS